MQNLESLLIFVTVADRGSFTDAAETLRIQKGRASTAVRKLEEELGARLLHRTTRKVQLTEDGRAFLARARELLSDAEDLSSMFADDKAALRGRLRVDMPAELARKTIVPALPDFLEKNPELELEVSSTDRQVDLVQEGIDCVVRLGPIRDETLIARQIGKFRIVNAASPKYLQRHGVPQSIEDLKRQGHRTIHFAPTSNARPLDGNTRTATATRVLSYRERSPSAAHRPTKRQRLPVLAWFRLPLLGLAPTWTAVRWSKCYLNTVGGRFPCH